MKVCVVCSGLSKDTIAKQPWKYFYQISVGLQEKGHTVCILTSIPEDEVRISTVPTKSVQFAFSLYNFPGTQVVDAIREEKPDIVLMNAAVTTFVSDMSRKIPVPVVAILTSPLYSVRDILRTGPREWLTHFSYLKVPLLCALVPKFVIRHRSRSFKAIVVLSEDNAVKLQAILPSAKIVTIPPGVDELFLAPPDSGHVREIRSEFAKGSPLVLYFTSPVTLRGTDTLLYAFSRLRNRYPARLLLLSRMDDPRLSADEKRLQKIAEQENIAGDIVILSKKLVPEQMVDFVSAADIVCLPYKIILSDVPVSYLEAMAAGKAMVGTKTGCNSRLLADRAILVMPNNPQELQNGLELLLSDPQLRGRIGDRGRSYVKNNHRWKQAIESMHDLINQSTTI